MDSHALPDDHVLKPLEDRMLEMCDDMHPAMRVLGGNFVAALRVYAKDHPGLVDSASPPWVSDDCTESAAYVPVVDAVRYSQAGSRYDDDGARIPWFPTVWLDKDTVQSILALFPGE